ncbi:5179_t:CDS:2, partial [Entrophospora sp. SA101]
MDFEDRFRNQEAEIRQLKADLLKFEIEKDGLKSLTIALKERILELQGTGNVDDIEIKTLKNENTKLQLKC